MKKYETAKIEVTKFQTEDILTTSGWYPDHNDGDNTAPGYGGGDIWDDIFG